MTNILVSSSSSSSIAKSRSTLFLTFGTWALSLFRLTKTFAAEFEEAAQQIICTSTRFKVMY